MADLTLRQTKGTELTYQEVDDNFVAASANRKNAVINGGMDICQRSTSISYTSSTANYSVDRWLASVNGTAKATVSQTPFVLGQTAVPGSPKYYLRYDKTIAGSIGTIWKHKIEGVTTFATETVTLSFYARASNNKPMSVQLVQNFGSGGSPSSNVSSTAQNFTATPVWKKFVFNFTLSSITGKTLGTNNDDALNVNINEEGTPQVVTIDIAQVQLEAGNVATAFEQLPTALTQALCERYYQTSYNQPRNSLSTSGAKTAWRGNANSAYTGLGCQVHFSTRMRAIPTVTIRNDLSQAGKVKDFYNNTYRDVQVTLLGQTGFSLLLVSGYANELGIYYHFEADAEL